MPTNLHPLVVHFPIALLLSSVVLYWAGLIWPEKGLDKAAWYTLLLGLAGAAVAVLSGLLAARGVPADNPATATIAIHRLLGIATLVVFGIQAICAWRSKGVYSRGKRVLHTIIQIIGIGLIVATGYYGGELVFAFGVGVAF